MTASTIGNTNTSSNIFLDTQVSNRQVAPSASILPDASGNYNYGAKNQNMSTPFDTVFDSFAQAGIGGEMNSRLQQAIARVVNNGADPNRVAASIEQVFQTAAKNGISDTNRIVQELAQLLSKIDDQTVDAKFKVIGEYLENFGTLGVGISNEVLGQLQNVVDQALKAGVDSNQLADAMIQVLQSAEQQDIDDPKQILNALMQVIQQAGQQAASADLQGIFNNLNKIGVAADTMTGLQQLVSQLINNGVDQNQIASVMQQILQNASRQGVTDPNQIVDVIVQALQDGQSGGVNLQTIFNYLGQIGIDQNTLAGLQQMVSLLIDSGIDETQIASVMQKILQTTAAQGGRQATG